MRVRVCTSGRPVSEPATTITRALENEIMAPLTHWLQPQTACLMSASPGREVPLPDEVRLSSHWPRICSSYRPAFLRDVGNTVGTDLRG